MATPLPDWLQSILLLLSIGLLIYMVMRQTSDTLRSLEMERVEVVTEIACNDGSRRTREYRDGDYIGAGTDECDGGRVVGIYARQPEGEGKSSKSSRSLPLRALVPEGIVN